MCVAGSAVPYAISDPGSTSANGSFSAVFERELPLLPQLGVGEYNITANFSNQVSYEVYLVEVECCILSTNQT